MQVSIRGEKNAKFRTILRKAAQFYAKELMHTNLVNHLDVTVHLIPKNKQHPDNGSCEWNDIDGPPNPRVFDIYVAKGLRKYEKLSTLAHEFVHLKQYAKNEMDGLTGNDNIVKWKGTEFKLNSKLAPARRGRNRLKINATGQDYYYLPWEVEAYGLEVGLACYFRQKHGLTDL